MLSNWKRVSFTVIAEEEEVYSEYKWKKRVFKIFLNFIRKIKHKTILDTSNLLCYNKYVCLCCCGLVNTNSMLFMYRYRAKLESLFGLLFVLTPKSVFNKYTNFMGVQELLALFLYGYNPDRFSVVGAVAVLCSCMPTQPRGAILNIDTYLLNLIQILWSSSSSSRILLLFSSRASKVNPN